MSESEVMAKLKEAVSKDDLNWSCENPKSDATSREVTITAYISRDDCHREGEEADGAKARTAKHIMIDTSKYEQAYYVNSIRIEKTDELEKVVWSKNANF
ncbi:hypothetical protein ACMFMG_000264 [Clarireedia jacksonii]